MGLVLKFIIHRLSHKDPVRYHETLHFHILEKWEKDVNALEAVVGHHGNVEASWSLDCMVH